MCLPPRNRLSACRSARVIVKAASEYKIWKAPPRARPRYHHLLTSQLPTHPTTLFIVTRTISPESPASVLSPRTSTTSCLPKRLPPLPRKRRRRHLLLSMPATLVSFRVVASQQCSQADIFRNRHWLTYHSYDPRSCYQRTCRHLIAPLAEFATPTVASFRRRATGVAPDCGALHSTPQWNRKPC